MKKSIAIVASMLLSGSAFAQSWGEPKLADDGSVYVSTDSARWNNSAIALYAYPENQCATLVSIITALDEPLVEGSTEVRYKYRVDRNPTVEVDGRVNQKSSSNGDEFYTIVVQSFLADDNFLSQFVTGEKIIFKTVDSNDETDEFSLTGSSKAMMALQENCNSIATTSGDEWGETSPARNSRNSSTSDNYEWES